MISRRRAATTTAALTCGVALLAGVASTAAASAGSSDGGEGDLADKSAQQISDDALQQLLAAQSLRLRTETSADPTKLDLTLDRAGNCTGAISKGEYGRVELVKRGDEVWMKPDAAFWKGLLPGKKGDDAAAKYRDTFLHGTTKNSFLRGVSAACDLKAFQKAATGPERRPSGTPPLTLGLPHQGPADHPGGHPCPPRRQEGPGRRRDPLRRHRRQALPPQTHRRGRPPDRHHPPEQLRHPGVHQDTRARRDGRHLGAGRPAEGLAGHLTTGQRGP